MPKTTTARQALTALYLEYINDFLTVEKFAEHHGITVEQAKVLIPLARSVVTTEHPES
jgi:hypothetical protein